MPKRKPPEMVTKHYSYPRPHTMTFPVTWWEKKDQERKRTDKWNEQATEYKRWLINEFASKHKLAVVVELHRFQRLSENLNKEKVKPRSYLSYEKLFLHHEGNDFIYYFGNYENLEQVTEHATIDILKNAERRKQAAKG